MPVVPAVYSTTVPPGGRRRRRAALDQVARQTVLHAAGGIGGFELGDNAGVALGHDMAQFDKRRVADGIENMIGLRHCALSPAAVTPDGFTDSTALRRLIGGAPAWRGGLETGRRRGIVGHGHRRRFPPTGARTPRRF